MKFLKLNTSDRPILVNIAHITKVGTYEIQTRDAGPKIKTYLVLTEDANPGNPTQKGSVVVNESFEDIEKMLMC